MIAVALLALALAHLDNPPNATMFICGAMLAVVALKHYLSSGAVRIFAFLAAGVLFFYFGRFFALVPDLQPGWHWRPGNNAAGLLLAGFVMIPVLSEYSCRMKKEDL